MNSHVKRWIDEIVESMSVGEKTTANAVREKLILRKGTTFVCDNSAIGWYLKRNKNIEVDLIGRGRRVYVRT